MPETPEPDRPDFAIGDAVVLVKPTFGPPRLLVVVGILWTREGKRYLCEDAIDCRWDECEPYAPHQLRPRQEAPDA